MTQNYFKGQITVVFPATPTSPLFGKILPIWGVKTNKGDQINFNMYALKENKRFPEEGGACEIDFKDTSRWTKKQNGNVEFYTPNVPFYVYFKIKATKNKDGSMKLVAVALHSEKTISLSDKTKAESVKVKPSDTELLNDNTKTPGQLLEEYVRLAEAESLKNHSGKKQKKHKKVAEENEEPEDDSLSAALEESYARDWAKDAANYTRPNYVVDNTKSSMYNDDINEIEEEEEEDLADTEEYDSYYAEPQKSTKQDWH